MEPLIIDASTVVLDARPAFDHSLSHIPKSISLHWSDFTQAQPDRARGLLQSDHFALARRLARLGLTPESKVVVVGRGLKGEGEEGRLAWTLRFLGIKQVRAAPISFFQAAMTNQPSVPFLPAAIWKPEVNERLLATREELFAVIKRRGVYQPMSPGPGLPAKLYRILDVRSPREYLGKEGLGLTRKIPNMEAINIDWREFFDPDTGLVNPAIKAQLESIGVTPAQRIIVISERGVRSAAVAMALMELGFADVANFAGGLQSLF